MEKNTNSKYPPLPSYGDEERLERTKLDYIDKNKKTPDQILIPKYFKRKFYEEGGWSDFIDTNLMSIDTYVEDYRRINGKGSVYTLISYDKNGIKTGGLVVMDLSLI